MSGHGPEQKQKLATLRGRIDAIDEEMHRLLIERGTVIGELIEAKGAKRTGAAFWPAREADMMRRFAARHAGDLPLTTVLHIWREIITTFTRMQAPFDIAADMSIAPDEMRDLARFLFGFSVDVRPMDDAAAVVGHVGQGAALGLIARAAPGCWWRRLEGEARPKIMALLPILGLYEGPADLPAFVISPPLTEPTPPDINAYSVVAETETLELPEGAVVLAEAEATNGRAFLVADERRRAMEDLVGSSDGDKLIVPIGGFAAPITAQGAPCALASLPAVEGVSS